MMTQEIKRLCDLVWANTQPGTKIGCVKHIQGRQQYFILSWSVQVIGETVLVLAYKIPSEMLSSDLGELSKTISGASDLLEQMVSDCVTLDQINDVVGNIYKTIHCEIESDGSVKSHWDCSKFGPFDFTVPHHAIDKVVNFDQNDRMVVVFKESWELVSNLFYSMTGRSLRGWVGT